MSEVYPLKAKPTFKNALLKIKDIPVQTPMFPWIKLENSVHTLFVCYMILECRRCNKQIIKKLSRNIMAINRTLIAIARKETK
jgi:hypothetical protein